METALWVGIDFFISNQSIFESHGGFRVFRRERRVGGTKRREGRDSRAFSKNGTALGQ